MCFREFSSCALIAISFALVAGCGGSAATVSGSVTIAGQPLAKGQIQFTPTGSGTPVGAPIVAGKYTAAMQPGEMTVLITETLDLPVVTSTEELQKQAASGLPPMPPPKSRITAMTTGNNRVETIKSGSQALDFPLSP